MVAQCVARPQRPSAAVLWGHGAGMQGPRQAATPSPTAERLRDASREAQWLRGRGKRGAGNQALLWGVPAGVSARQRWWLRG